MIITEKEMEGGMSQRKVAENSESEETQKHV